MNVSCFRGVLPRFALDTLALSLIYLFDIHTRLQALIVSPTREIAIQSEQVSEVGLHL